MYKNNNINYSARSVCSKVTFKCDCLHKLGLNLDEAVKARIALKCHVCSPIEPIYKREFHYKSKCFRCKRKGHVISKCPFKVSPWNEQSNYMSARVRKAVVSVMSKIKEFDEIRGSCLINNLKREFLMDTGAQRTIINPRILNEEERSKVRMTNVRMVTATGWEGNCVGVWRTKIQHGEYTCLMDILVSEELHEDCIIGMDFLRTSTTTKDYLYALKKAIDDGSAFVQEMKNIESEKNCLNQQENVKVCKVSVINQIEFEKLSLPINAGRHRN